MRSCVRTATRIAVVLGVVMVHPAQVFPQDLQGRITIAATNVSELQSRGGGALVDRMVRDRELVVRVAYNDRLLPDHSHETLSQYYENVPVYGGELMIHRTRGVAVSILGSIYEGIDLQTSPTLSAEQAGEIIERVSGSTLGPDPPTLTISPMLFRGYALTYMVTTSSAMTYVLDAHDGHIRLEYSEKRTQTSSCRPGVSNCAVGVGVGVLGDQKKVSTTEAGGVFEARDSFRPAEILTLDLRGNGGSYDRLSGDDGISPGFLPSDLASDGDNSWTDSQVVDAHVHVGWITDYLARQHGYNGIDNRNGRIFTLVNLPTDVAEANAFYSPPPTGPEGNGFMAFGEFEDGVPLTALDIVGHEVTHGVTRFRPAGNLVRFNIVGRFASDGCTPDATIPVIRSGEVLTVLPADFNFEGTGASFVCDSGRFAEVANVAGAVGEGFGDLVGTSAEFFFDHATTPDYVIGEDLPGHDPVRSLEDPASMTDCFIFASGSIFLDQPCPDHFSRRAEVPLVEFPDGSVFYWGGIVFDFGGEHINSTIFSHAFYLAIEGGTNRTSGVAVQGVGGANRQQIEEVFFNALIDEIPSSPSWFDAAVAILQTAINRFGNTSATTIAVAQALVAVGLL